MKILLLFIFLVGGCTAVNPEAKQVVVYSQESTLISGCERIQTLEAAASKATNLYPLQAAENKLRNQAATLGADSVVLTNVDDNVVSISVQGVALSCSS